MSEIIFFSVQTKKEKMNLIDNVAPESNSGIALALPLFFFSSIFTRLQTGGER